MSNRMKAGVVANGVVNRIGGESTGLLDGLFRETAKAAKKRLQPMTTTVETITPKKASEYLKLNTRNRRARQRRVDRFVQLMASGQFQLTHQGIAFAPDGSLIDGQHRLMAIEKSGVTAKMNVARNAPESSVPVLDLPELRTIPDLAGALGLNVDITNQMVGIAKQMMFSVGPSPRSHRSMSNETWINYILTHEQAIRYAINSLSSTQIRHCVFRSVVARAWYTSDLARLDQFCDVLTNGMTKSHADVAAIKVRDIYLSRRGTFGGQSSRFMLYRKTESALSAFLKGKQLMLLREVGEELFPIPGDE